MVEKSKLDEDLQRKPVDPTHYHGMIGTIMYLTSSRSYLVFAVCMCARYQAKPTEKHLHAVKQIFRYLKGTSDMGIWYSKDSCITLTAYADADQNGSKHLDVRYHYIKEQVENGVVELYFVRKEYQQADIYTKALPRERFKFLIEKLGMKSMSPETVESLAKEEGELESIRILIANVANKNMTIYQMDVKNAFLNGELREVVYALYGLKEASRAWYDMLSSFLISQEFSKGAVHPTLFTRRAGCDILLRYGMQSSNPVDTPMVEKSKLDEDLQRKPVDPTHYHGMIGTIMYLTSSRSYLVFAVCMCARYQEKPTEKHLHAVKQIFRYLKGTSDMGIWYSKDSCITLTAYVDADLNGIMKQDKAQQAARDEKLVPSDDSVKIGKSNLRMDPSVTQKKETYQVILDIIKNTPFHNAFLIYANILVIYLQQFWLTIKKTCLLITCINHGEPWELLSMDAYRGKRPTMTDSDRQELKFCGGMYHKKNVDYAAWIWEDLQYHIDNRQSKTTKPKKKQKKRKQLIHDETNESEGELENKLTERKKRTPRVVVIQEHLSVLVNKTVDSSKKLKGIELLSDAAQLEIDTQKAIKAGRHESRFHHQSGGSSEGASLVPEVSDEPTEKSANSDEGAGTSPEVKGVEEMNIVEEADEENTERVEEQKDDEELKADEEQKEDDQAGDEQVVAVKELKQADHSNTILVSIRCHIPSVVEDYLGSSLSDALKKKKVTILIKFSRKETMEMIKMKTLQLDQTRENPKGHKSPIDMSKPLPMQDKQGRLAIPVEFFFNNDLEYLKAGNKDRSYSSSIIKTLAARRADQKLYKFKEGLKLLNLDSDVIVDFVATLKMFTRGIIVKNRVKDMQLVKEPYIPNYDPLGIIYEDKSKKKRLMHVDEIHEFCDRTLQYVHKILHEMLLNFKFGYNKDMPLREWTTKDKKRTSIMLNKIDDLQFKRRVLRILEVLVRGRKT
nr:hypothetical protein [Tanacetum cinerariifolium]